ncbi:hypothetical protein EVAR_90570_1 [Eumeta japonica]|uniref:Uncharacterized protein n=1 Tax=Eumeta variegata TaxID=151549 RepID=A0A4C1YQH7_EUMVA|nr:hypothetical protein EVAR_90570_1 [Eumeta japonica]
MLAPENSDIGSDDEGERAQNKEQRQDFFFLLRRRRTCILAEFSLRSVLVSLPNVNNEEVAEVCSTATLGERGAGGAGRSDFRRGPAPRRGRLLNFTKLRDNAKKYSHRDLSLGEF